jgi:hypothetical protein
VRCAIDTGGTFTDPALEVEHRTREISQRLGPYVLAAVPAP